MTVAESTAARSGDQPIATDGGADEPVDLLVEGTLVNVLTGAFEQRSIAVDDGEIVALESRPAERVITAEYVTPGLIDAHTHVEDAMVSLPRYGEAVVPHGVTSVIHDPHEVANVLGVEGILQMVADAGNTPLKARCTVPSSVPASDLQDAGATVGADDVASLLDLDNAVALGEVMNVPAVLDGEREVHAKIDDARERGLPVDGHAPGVDGTALQAYARHVDNDHESTALAEAREKYDAGLRVYLREGSTSRNLADLAPILDAVDSRRLSLCTDERNVVDLVEDGSVNVGLEMLLSSGADPVQAIQLATLNTAEAYDLPYGKIAPGAPADMVVLSDLVDWEVEHVVIDGVVDPTQGRQSPPDSAVATDTVQFDPVRPRDLAIEYDGEGPVKVRAFAPVGDFQTERRRAALPVTTMEGRTVVAGDTDLDVLPMAVIERHGGDGLIGRGFVADVGLERGAIATTVAHDAHNCVVLGASHAAMAVAANYLRESGGGIAVYDPVDDAVTALDLPVAGLTSNAPLEDVKADFEAVEVAACDIGRRNPGGLLELTFLALEVIPTYRLTNRGLVDCDTMELVDVVVE